MTLRIIPKINSTWLDFPTQDYAIILMVVGCDRSCTGCHNDELKTFDSNIHSEVEIEKIADMIRNRGKREKTNKLVISGGDPLSDYNYRGVCALVNMLSNEFEICIYTGANYSEAELKLLSQRCYPKYLKTGEFNYDMVEQSYKDDNGLQLASTNQEMREFLEYDYMLISKNGFININLKD